MIRLLSGDCRDVLPTLPAESVQCCITSPPYYALRSYLDASHPDKHREIGSEPTPDEYLATMVGVFREVRRVLRRDGTCWVNMGDSYNANQGTPWRPDSGGGFGGNHASPKVSTGLAPKQLLLMPARLALALQADGWWVRSAIVWAKPNPMPESVSDRPTSAYEMVYLLTRSAKYFYDADAVREAPTWSEAIGTKPAAGRERNIGGRTDGYTRIAEGGGVGCPEGGRNLRNVWTIATHAYSAAHFATFPPELAERCIKAGTSERGCCAVCGKPWVRVTEMAPEYRALLDSGKAWRDTSGKPDAFTNRQPSDHPANVPQKHITTGWLPGCQCGTTETRPCVVLDPFAGAGTTLLVADRLQRDAIGIELNTAYTEMAMERCRADAPLFTSFPPAEDPEETRMADLFTDMAAD